MNKKWWLISDGDVETIKRGLRGGTYTFPAVANDALNTLVTGLHETDAVPAKFAPPRVSGDVAGDALASGDWLGYEPGEPPSETRGG